MYCFKVELSAEGAKQGVELTPKVFFPDNPPRPSRPKAGLGLVMIMMMIECVCQADGDAIAGSVLRNNATTRQGLLLIPTT